MKLKKLKKAALEPTEVISESVMEKWFNKKTTKWDTTYWWMRHGIWQWLGDRPLKIRSFFQRGQRGYADEDIWGFDYYLTRVILGGLKQLKKNKCGCPCVLPYDPNVHPNDVDWDKNQKAWDEILDTMIYAFEVSDKILNDDPAWYCIPSAEFTEEEYNKKKEQFKNVLYVMTLEEIKKYELGWKNFQTYYFNLWD